MISPKAAVEQMLFDELSDAITDAAVFQDVPEDHPMPLVIIGDIEGFPFASAGDPDRRITATIITLTEGDERAPCTDLQDQQELAFDGRSFFVEPWNLHCSVASSEAGLAEDGSGYVGTLTLNVLAFHED